MANTIAVHGATSRRDGTRLRHKAWKNVRQERRSPQFRWKVVVRNYSRGTALDWIPTYGIIEGSIHNDGRGANDQERSCRVRLEKERALSDNAAGASARFRVYEEVLSLDRN